MTLDDYIAARTVEDGDCLRWTGTTYNGHPGGTLDGKKFLIRRALWLRDRGEIPKGKVLRCTCDLDLCVNLNHCTPMTMRAITKIEGAAGKMSGPIRSAKIAAAKRAGRQAKVTQEQVREIRASDEPGTVLAARHGVSEATISKYRLGHCRREFAGNVWQGLGA